MEISIWYDWCLCAQLSTKNGINIFCLSYQTGMVGVYVHGYSGYSVLVFPHINAVYEYKLLSIKILQNRRICACNFLCLTD